MRLQEFANFSIEILNAFGNVYLSFLVDLFYYSYFVHDEVKLVYSG